MPSKEWKLKIRNLLKDINAHPTGSTAWQLLEMSVSNYLVSKGWIILTPPFEGNPPRIEVTPAGLREANS